MKVHIKSNDRACTVEVEPETTVEDLGKKLASEHNLPSDVSRLVYRGRILKGPPTQTLASHNITDGATIYMLKTAAAASAPAPAPTAASAAPAAPALTPTPPPNPFANLGAGNAGNPFAGLGGGIPGMPGIDPAMINTMMQNPMMQQMMNDMMSNPEFVRNAIQSNPMLQNMFSNSPILSQSLNDPALFQQMMNLGAAQAGSPGMFGGGAGAAAAPAAAPPTQAAPPPMPDLNSLAALLGGAPPSGTTGPAATGARPGGDFLSAMNQMMQDPAMQQGLNNFMQRMGGGGGMGGMAGLDQLLGGLGGQAPAGAMGGAPVGNLSERYGEQLKSLEDMGFLDRDANLQALTRSNGDINVAISTLLEQGFGN